MRSLTRALLVVVIPALLAAGCSAGGGGTPSAQPASSTRAVAPKATPPATPPAATVATPAPTLASGQYVALGDSYTAAPKISGQVGTPAGCGRSSDSYPMLVARQLGLSASRVDDVSCDSATIADLTGSQVTSAGTNPAQLGALSPGTTLVTLGVGGNDVHWTAILGECVKLDARTVLLGSSTAQSSAQCQKHYTAGRQDQVQQYIRAAAGPLAAALAQVKQRAPNARVYVIGYPDLMPSSGNSACEHTFFITPPDMAFLNTEEQRLNAMLRQQATAAGATYVDTYTPSQGHSACAAPKERWVEPWLPASPADPLHPDATGERGMATALLRAIAASQRG
ncbi:MAG TPA: SGNH/GDSL hydrolase family protein [Trebonia sp.]|nr:SGNH/GDSL hydrolase family protein [Trebonia sp.]